MSFHCLGQVSPLFSLRSYSSGILPPSLFSCGGDAMSFLFDLWKIRQEYFTTGKNQFYMTYGVWTSACCLGWQFPRWKSDPTLIRCHNGNQSLCHWKSASTQFFFFFVTTKREVDFLHAQRSNIDKDRSKRIVVFELVNENRFKMNCQTWVQNRTKSSLIAQNLVYIALRLITWPRCYAGTTVAFFLIFFLLPLLWSAVASRRRGKSAPTSDPRWASSEKHDGSAVLHRTINSSSLTRVRVSLLNRCAFVSLLSPRRLSSLGLWVNKR